MTPTRLSLLALLTAASCVPPGDPLVQQDGSDLRRSDGGSRNDAGSTTTTDAGSSDAGLISKPNVLLIIADDMGIETSPCYTIGSSNMRPSMPTLSALCDNGLVFDNFWSKTECSPARSSLITGKYGFRTNVGSAGDILDAGFPSLQEAMTGYQNAVIGKWHLGGNVVSIPQVKGLGVQYYSGIWIGAVTSYTDWTETNWDGSQTQHVSTYVTEKLTTEAKSWLDTAQQPWFLWLAYNAPHTPYHTPPAGTYTTTITNDLSKQTAALEALDHYMSQVIDGLSPEVRANTMIIFMGDNGTAGMTAQSPYSSATAKATLYDGATHTPLIISGANVTRKGERESGLVQVEDLMATIAAVGGASVSGDGVSFAGALTAANATSRSVLYAEFFRGNGVARMDNSAEFGWTVRGSQYQYVHKTSGAKELFDLTTDPGTTVNLLSGSSATTYQAIADDLEDAGVVIRSH